MSAVVRRIQPLLFVAALTVGCDSQDDAPSRRSSRASKYASSSDAAPTDSPRASEDSRESLDDLPPGPPETEDANVLEAASRPRIVGYTPVGTRAQKLRCQGALGTAADYFAPSWYAYDDTANPGIPLPGCEMGHSDSMLEALPWDDENPLLCSIRWEGTIRAGSTYPFIGAGVRALAGLPGLKSVTVETRSTGEPVDIQAMLIMEEQEVLGCADMRKAPYEKTLKCDGSGEWRAQTLHFKDFKPNWGEPPPLRMDTAVALHFQNVPGFEGELKCDLRVIAVEQ